MDGMGFIDTASFNTPPPPEPRHLRSQVHNAALMAVIVAATFAALIVLDRAGVHLPAGDELLAALPSN